MSYTALGSTINLASRVEQLNKSYGTQILASEAIRERADAHFLFRAVDRIRPKGFAEAVKLFELRCERTGDISVELELCRQWDEIYPLIEELRAGAAARVLAFLQTYPDDGVARFHARRMSASATRTMPG